MKTPAKIARMVTPDHLCPWGIKALDLLKRHGYSVTDHHIESKEANAAYKEEHNVSETPQIWIEGEHIGGYDALREHLGIGPDPKEGKTYRPILAVLAVTALLATATAWRIDAAFSPIRWVELFIAFSMTVLGILKLQDLQSFATGFVKYDLLAQRYVPYASIYAYIETGAGLLMIANVATFPAAIIVLLASTVGAISVFLAVYIQKRELACACVGGDSDVPLGALSLTENLMMMALSTWMIVKFFL